ncbi:MAG: hypothetical protein IJJ56_04510 [Prevotella sp.]|nr:hypothetical protein [Prevotella sp.]
MKIYILQEDYTEIEPEAYFNEESGGYDSKEYNCRDIIGVFLTLEAAADRLVEVVDNADADDYFYCGRKELCGYDILVADTETTEVKVVSRSIYRDMFKSKQLGMEVKTIREEA